MKTKDKEIFSVSEGSRDDVFDAFQAALTELELDAVELADYMTKQGGDYRPYNTILRSIQRMISRETRVSGEMFVIVRMLLRQHRRLKYRYPNVIWKRHSRAALSAQVEDFTVFLSPQTKGRWVVSCQAPSGFSPPFGRWQDDLNAAKSKSLRCVEEGMNDVAELEFESAV